jgi:hypothetical protein
MTLRVREATADEPNGAAVVRSIDAVTRRPIVATVLLTVALLAPGAVGSVSSGAATVPAAKKPTVTSPGVSPVTVTVPGGRTSPVTAPPVTKPPATAPPVTTPPVTPPPVKVRPVVRPPVASPPSSTAPAAPRASAPPASSVSALGGGSHATRSPGAPGSAASYQRRLRSVVVRLSGCLSALNPGSQKMLLLRAGIGRAGSARPGAVARTLRIGVAREARIEHAALLKLQAAAREHTCASTPAWIRVPAGNRLVLVDPALASAAHPAAKISLSLSASRTISPLVAEFVDEWWRLMRMPAPRS